MKTITVAIPVLSRPQNAQAVVASLELSDPNELCRPLFVTSPGDLRQIEACHATGADVLMADWPTGPGDYQRKINLAVRATTEPFVFTGADDLRFHPGWADEALRVASQHNAGMVGTDDMGNGLVRQGLHSTHSLFSRRYIDECGTIDQPGLVYHEGYGHQHCDVEAYETAVARGCFAFAPAAAVEHLHFLWNKGQRDATYDKGLSTSDEDLALYRSRRHLWQAIAA